MRCATSLFVLLGAVSAVACSPASEQDSTPLVTVEPGRVSPRAVACVVAPVLQPVRACAVAVDDPNPMPGYCPPGFLPVGHAVGGAEECWCSGACPDGGADAAVDAGPPCKTCADIGATACGRFDDGCGGRITCSTCPDGELCDLAKSSCGACSAPPNTPGSSSTPPFEGWKFELPGGQLLCKGIRKIPYLGTAIAAGFDKGTIKASMVSGGSSSSTGMQKCVEKTKSSETQSWSLDVCAVTLAYTANGSGEGTSTYCAECTDGVGRCGALSCNEQKETAGGRGSVTRKIREVSGLGDLILCPAGDSTCKDFAARLSKRFGIEIEGGVTASAGSKKTTKSQTPGTCSPCEDCTEKSRSFEPSLVGSVKGTFKLTLFDAGRWGKVAAGLSVGAFVGLGGSVSNTVKSGACGAANCTEISGNVQGGIFIEFSVQAFRFERNWSWVGRCQGSLGGKYCEPGGLSPTFDFKCSANDASVFDSGAD